MAREWAMFFLALVTVPIVLAEELATDPAQRGAATAASALVWLAFAADLAVSLRQGPGRGAVLRRRWADVAVVLLTPPFFSPELQALRVLRVVRLIRLTAIVAIVYDALGRPLGRSGALALVALGAMVLLAGGLAITFAEPVVAPTVPHGYGWAALTLLTLGRGAAEPLTPAGKIISTAIVVLGCGVIAALASALRRDGTGGGVSS